MDAREFILAHAERPYDPQVRRERYLRTRQLKGRKPGASINPVGKPSGGGGSGETAARVRELRVRLKRLNDLLAQYVKQAQARSGKEPETDKESSKAEPAKKADRKTTAEKKEAADKAQEKRDKEKKPNLNSQEANLEKRIADVREKISAMREQLAQQRSSKPQVGGSIRPVNSDRKATIRPERKRQNGSKA